MQSIVMLSVTYKLLMLSVIMLNAVIVSVIMLSVVAPESRIEEARSLRYQEIPQ